MNIIERFLFNNKKIEEYLEKINETVTPKPELDLQSIKKQIYLDFQEIAVFSKEYWISMGVKSFKQSCFLLNYKNNFDEVYHMSQVEY